MRPRRAAPYRRTRAQPGFIRFNVTLYVQMYIRIAPSCAYNTHARYTSRHQGKPIKQRHEFFKSPTSALTSELIGPGAALIKVPRGAERAARIITHYIALSLARSLLRRPASPGKPRAAATDKGIAAQPQVSPKVLTSYEKPRPKKCM